MSWALSGLVARKDVGSTTRKYLLHAMADKANDDGSGVYASFQTLADMVGASRATVKRVVKDFLDEGLIVHVGMRPCDTGQTNEFDLNVDRIQSLPDAGRRKAAAARKSCAAAQSSDASKARGPAPHDPVLHCDPAHDDPAPDDPGSSLRRPVQNDPGPGSSRTQTRVMATPKPIQNLIQNPIGSRAAPDPTPAEASPTPPSKPPKSPPPPDPAPIGQALNAFNAAAQRAGWVAAKALTAKRRAAIAARLRENGFDGWLAQIAAAEAMPFLAGDNDRGWRMDLDYFTRPSGWTAIAEGKFRRAAAPRRAAPAPMPAPSDAFARPRLICKRRIETGQWPIGVSEIDIPSAVRREFPALFQGAAA